MLAIRERLFSAYGYNIHAVAEGTAIVFTAVNRTKIPVWNCSSIVDCNLYESSSQYAMTGGSDVLMGWDPLCESFYKGCEGAHGVSNRKEWLEVIDRAVTSYHLVKSDLLADFTRGADTFAHSTLSGHYSDAHFYISHIENGVEVGGKTEDRRLADVMCAAIDTNDQVVSCEEFLAQLSTK